MCLLRLLLRRREYGYRRHRPDRAFRHDARDADNADDSHDRPRHRCPHDRSTGTAPPAEKVIDVTTTAAWKSPTGSMYACHFSGDAGLDTLLASDGVASENDLFAYFRKQISALDAADASGTFPVMGCSTVAVKDENGQALFGRNLDWPRSPGSS